MFHDDYMSATYPPMVTLYTEKGQSIKVVRTDVPYILSEDPTHRFIRCPLCTKSRWYNWRNKGIHKDSGPCPSRRLKKGYCPICTRNNVSRPFWAKTSDEVDARREEHMLAYHRQEAIREFGLPDKPRDWHNMYVVVPKPKPVDVIFAKVPKPLTSVDRIKRFIRNVVTELRK